MRQVLIDGYNLMHAAGFISKQTKAAGLDASRRRFLDYLAERVQGRDVKVGVVLDAAKAPSRVPEVSTYRGITVYSAKQQEADDLIEELIRKQSVPKDLAVVSNDRRVRIAAERRGCLSLRSGEFLDWLERLAQKRPDGERSANGEKVAPGGAVEEWLREFGHLDDDPTLGKPLRFPKGSQESP